MWRIYIKASLSLFFIVDVLAKHTALIMIQSAVVGYWCLRHQLLWHSAHFKEKYIFLKKTFECGFSFC